MRTLFTIFALSLASTVSAANMWFDPPNPTSETSVIAHVLETGTPCGQGATVQRHGNIISISLPPPVCLTPPLPGFFETPVNLGVLPAGVYDVVAGYGQILVGVAEGTLVVRDAQPAFNIFPDAGRPGDIIAISGAGDCVAPACSVTFGGVASPSFSTKDSLLYVQVPQLGSGVVDVSVGPKTATAAFDVTTGGTLDPAFFTPVLVPVFFSGNGAHGSQWRTELSVANDNLFPVPNDSELFTAPCSVTGTCIDGIPQGLTGMAIGQTDSEGKLIHVDRQGASLLFFDARIRDLSRQAQDLGAELPVVREKDFHAGQVDLLNVPTDALFRVTLRAYRIDNVSNLFMQIRPMAAPSSQPLVSTTLSLHAVDGLQVATIGDLVGTYPQLAGQGPLVIRLYSQTPQPATWAFVSITNNDTQHVTVIAPQ